MKRFLKYARIDSFGAFSNKTVGPFAPGMNVVFGKNEAGKTTLSQFVGGLLFGWEDARTNRNTYKPDYAERAGALVFAERPEGALEAGDSSLVEDASRETFDESPVQGTVLQNETVISRSRNADGLIGDQSVVADIDRETFRTMFLLTSDELRSLRNTTDITSHLLTAGSGTEASPTYALADVNDRIQAYSSKAASATNSLVRIADDMKATRARIQRAVDETERLKSETREYRALEGKREELSRRISSANEQIDSLIDKRAQLKRMDEQREILLDELADLKEQARDWQRDATPENEANAFESELLELAPVEERALREKMDDLSERQVRADHALQTAESDYAASVAAYDALTELQGNEAKATDRNNQRTLKIVLSIALPIVFAVLGVPVFMQGRVIGSLSFSVLGAVLILFALVLAVAAVFLVARPERDEKTFDSRLQDTQWVMLQDQKKLDQAKAAKDAVDEQVARWLSGNGFGQAGGSIRVARSILDEVRDFRAKNELRNQQAASYEISLANAKNSLSDLDMQRNRLIRSVGEIADEEWANLVSSATRTTPLDESSIGKVVARKSAQRDEMVSSLEKIGLRYGELGEQLARARDMRELDEAKQHYQELRTRMADGKAELANLLTTRFLLEKAVEEWESRSQPEVYRRAGELLSLMTDGAWIRVALSSEGTIIATDAARNERDPKHLSLGTCQQLYLALRIALLMCADNVGESVPILADDILVNFDSQRRAGAARALAQLARTRQVIVFTCHEEVVEAMGMADPACTVIDL